MAALSVRDVDDDLKARPSAGPLLATRNTKDFVDTGVGVVDPWERSGSRGG
jgi:hypothetical protein